jgi:ElaB/YqjD/DUF883 family membrane-anchored ribosome-binding protein
MREALHNEHRSSDDIRQDIERTRLEMDHTLLALQDKLSARGLLEQGRHLLHEAIWRPHILRILRASPYAAATAAASLAGAGASLAYLVAEGASEERLLRAEARQKIEHLPSETAGGRMVEPGSEAGGGLGGRITHLLHDWKGRAQRRLLKRQAAAARKAMAAAGTGTQGRAGHVQEAAREGWEKAAGPIREGWQETAGTIREGWQKTAQAARGAVAQVRENPLATAAAGVAAGALLGILLPAWPQRQSKRSAAKEAKPQAVCKESFEKAEQITVHHAPPAGGEGEPVI